MSAVSAIAAGRAPGTGRGLAAHRLLGALPLPRPVTIGLAAPFARPARAAVTLVVVLAGAAAVTLAAGVSGTLGQVVNGLTHSATEQVQAHLQRCHGARAAPAGAPGRARAAPRRPGRDPPLPRRRWTPRSSGPSPQRCAHSREHCTTPPRPTGRPGWRAWPASSR